MFSQYVFNRFKSGGTLLISWFINFKGALSGLRQFLATESPLQMMESIFYFTLKAFFILKIFKLLSWLFGQAEKRFVITMKSQPGKQTISTHILPNILKSRRSNQAMKVGQLMECNINFYLKNHTQNVLEKLFPDIFSKR